MTIDIIFLKKWTGRRATYILKKENLNIQIKLFTSRVKKHHKRGVQEREITKTRRFSPTRTQREVNFILDSF